MNVRVLYISYVDAKASSSGSGVRPAKMLKAFREAGHELIVLSGNQAGKDRVQNVESALQEVRKRKPDLCYIESPTYPIMRHADRKLIQSIHRMGVPIGYFYRDFYRMFPEEFPGRKDFFGRCKDLGLNVLQALTDRCLYNCDIVYVPSAEAAHLLPYHDVRALPPAGENHLPLRKESNRTAIYVGGLRGQYDIGLILDAFSDLNRAEQRYDLIIVCRKAEWERLEHPAKEQQWLHVYHVSGEELYSLYDRASIAVSAKSGSRYNDFAVSVKTYEYMGFGLPQVVCEGKAVVPLIENEGIGLAVGRSKEDFAQAVQLLFADRALYDRMQSRIRDSLLNRNLWTHRVETVVNDLTAGRKVKVDE